jgi:hypothetical protein
MRKNARSPSANTPTDAPTTTPIKTACRLANEESSIGGAAPFRIVVFIPLVFRGAAVGKTTEVEVVVNTLVEGAGNIDVIMLSVITKFTLVGCGDTVIVDVASVAKDSGIVVVGILSPSRGG